MWSLYLNAGAPVWRGDHTAAVLVEARLVALGSSSQFLHKQKETERKCRWLIQFPRIPSLKGTATCSVELSGKPNMTVPEKRMVQLKHMELRLNGWQRHRRPRNSRILVGSVLKTHQNSHRSVPISAVPVQAFLLEIVWLPLSPQYWRADSVQALLSSKLHRRWQTREPRMQHWGYRPAQYQTIWQEFQIFLPPFSLSWSFPC